MLVYNLETNELEIKMKNFESLFLYFNSMQTVIISER